MKQGFTIIQIVLAAAMMAIFATVIILSLPTRRSKVELDSTTQRIIALLREAQSSAAAQVSSSGWGVYFDNIATSTPFYSLFYSGTYNTSTRQGYYRFPTTIAYVTSSLNEGASTTISFSPLTGFAVASRSVSIYVKSNRAISSTISVSSSGVVTY